MVLAIIFDYLCKDEPIKCKPHHEHVKIGGRQSSSNFNRVNSSKYDDLDFDLIKESPKDKKYSLERNKQTRDGLDSKTLKILSKYLNCGLFKEINGCIAQGKEATIFHAFAGLYSTINDDEIFNLFDEYAIKVYKTTKIEFKDREKYMEGEWRFRSYLNKTNKHTIAIPLWAEKEFRNLKRLQNHDIPCPTPVLLKKHIVVLSFIGSHGKPAQQLGQINVRYDLWVQYYWEIIDLMRKMYQLSGLVHADLSSYNILVYQDKLWIIDLSQAVLFNHPSSIQFLKRDCKNITKFFYSKGISDIMSIRELLEFIITKDINVEIYLDNVKNIIKERSDQNIENILFEEDWLESFTPRTLIDINDPFNFDIDISDTLKTYMNEEENK